MIELLLARGWLFSHNCACAIPGKIYKKQGFKGYKVKILKRNTNRFHFHLPDGSYIQDDGAEALGKYLNHHGL